MPSVCVCVFILPAGSYVGVKAHYCFYINKDFGMKRRKTAMAKSPCLATGHYSVPFSPQAPCGRHAGPGN